MKSTVQKVETFTCSAVMKLSDPTFQGLHVISLAPCKAAINKLPLYFIRTVSDEARSNQRAPDTSINYHECGTFRKTPEVRHIMEDSVEVSTFLLIGSSLQMNGLSLDKDLISEFLL